MVTGYWLARALAVAVAPTVAAAADAGPAERCRDVLTGMEEHTDFEVKALCRARFPLHFCGQAHALLGDRPWAVEGIEDACNQWVSAWPSGETNRVLEEATQDKNLTIPNASVTPNLTPNLTLVSLDLSTTTKTSTTQQMNTTPAMTATEVAAKYEEASVAAPMAATAHPWPLLATGVGLAAAALVGSGAVLVLRRQRRRSAIFEHVWAAEEVLAGDDDSSCIE